MINTAELKRLRDADIANCDPAQLVDIRTVSVQRSGTSAQRLDSFVAQIRNPYLFKVGDVAVKLEFGGAKQLEDTLAALLRAE